MPPVIVVGIPLRNPVEVAKVIVKSSLPETPSKISSLNPVVIFSGISKIIFLGVPPKMVPEGSGNSRRKGENSAPEKDSIGNRVLKLMTRSRFY